MRLTELLFKKQEPLRRLISGKHRIPRVVTGMHKAKVLEDLAREEENLFYLRQPYLTPDQSRLLLQIDSKKNKEAYAEMVQARIKKAMYKDVTFEQRLIHLAKMNEDWD